MNIGWELSVLERNLIMANEFAGQLIKGRTARVSDESFLLQIIFPGLEEICWQSSLKKQLLEVL